MFASAKLFSNITCPYHNECMLPDCIFAHPEDGGGEDEDIAPASVSTPHEQGIVGLETSEHVVEPKSDKSSDSTLRSPSKTKDRNGNPRRLLTDQDISPPPLRRKALNGSSIPVKSSAPYENGMKRQNPNDATTPSATRTTPKAPTGAAPKKEALNPRHLPAGAPAKFEIRFRLVTMLHEHLTRLNSELAKDANDEEEKLVLSDQELITMTLDMEENAALYQTSIYSNVVKNHILMYKKMLVGQWKDEREADLQKVKAAEAALLSNKSIVKSTEPPKPIETGLTTDEELQVLPRLYTPISGLSKHGYVNSIPTDKDIETAQQGIEAAKGWEVCDRCKARFQVFPERREQDGALTSGGSCTYHYGKPYWQERSAAEPKAKREKRYRCCGQAMGDSSGCTEATSHVFKISEIKRMAAVLNFEKTPENPNKVASRPVCIDGEMGYTVFGLELIRLTATSWPTGVELFDILVRPMGPVLGLELQILGSLAKRPSRSSSMGFRVWKQVGNRGKAPTPHSRITCGSKSTSILPHIPRDTANRPWP